MVTPAITGTPATGSRSGAGTVTVTPPAPAGTVAWLALVLNDFTGSVITPPAGFEHLTSVGGGAHPVEVYLATDAPGSSWGLSGTGGDQGGLVIVVPLNMPITVTGGTGASGLSSPSITVPGDTLVLRMISGARANGDTLGYPTTATMGRAAVAQSLDGFYLFAALAAQQIETAGTAAAATWTDSTSSVWDSDAATIGLISDITAPAAPTGLVVTAAGGGVNVTVDEVEDASGYVVRWRDLSYIAPASHTQSSAPDFLDHIDGTDNGTYTYRGTGAGVRMYFIGSGIRYTHEEFTGRTAPGFSLGATPYDTDAINHETSVASIAAGTTYGVAKGATIISVNINDNPGTNNGLPGDAMEDCVDFILSDLAAHPAPAVVNISTGLAGLVEGTAGAEDNAVVDAQLKRLLDAGVVITAAALYGNRNIAADAANSDPRIIWVSSSDLDDVKDADSNYGRDDLIFAPAGGFNSITAASNGWDTDTHTFGQTSGAAPMVAGVAARIKQVRPDLSPARIKEIILSQASAVVTSVPAGGTWLLNANANPGDWSEYSAEGNAITLDGVPWGVRMEIQVASVNAAGQSDWTTTKTTSTSPVYLGDQLVSLHMGEDLVVLA